MRTEHDALELALSFVRGNPVDNRALFEELVRRRGVYAQHNYPVGRLPDEKEKRVLGSLMGRDKFELGLQILTITLQVLSSGTDGADLPTFDNFASY